LALAEFNTEKSVEVDYTFINDNENLYILFIFKDKKYLSSLAKTGLTVWFNNQGKKKKEIGVHCQTRLVSADGMIALTEQSKGPLTEDRKSQIRSKPSYYINQCLLLDKDSKLQAKQFGNAAPPEFAVLGGNNRLVFEFKIPLAAGNLLGLAAGKSTLVGFEWGGSPNKELKGEGASGDTVSQESDNEYQEYNEDEGGMPSGQNFPTWNRPKRYSFWCELLLAAGK